MGGGDGTLKLFSGAEMLMAHERALSHPPVSDGAITNYSSIKSRRAAFTPPSEGPGGRLVGGRRMEGTKKKKAERLDKR